MAGGTRSGGGLPLGGAKMEKFLLELCPWLLLGVIILGAAIGIFKALTSIGK